MNATVAATGMRGKATAAFKVVRGPATTYQPQITYPNGSTQTIIVKELRALFPAVVYSQGELAEIGAKTGKKTQVSDLLQFLNPDFKREDDRITVDIGSTKGAIKTAIQALTAHWTQQAMLRKLITERDALKQRKMECCRSLFFPHKGRLGSEIPD